MKIRAWTPLLFAFAFLLALFSLRHPAANADRGELRSVQQSIQRSGARWTAGQTTLSGRSLEERRFYLGLNKVLSPRRVAASLSFQTQDLPSHLDWRDHLGNNWVTPVKDQGPCGSCWAFSAVAALESAISIRARNPIRLLDLSEQFLLSCSPGTCDGYWLGQTMAFLQNTGTVDEACFRYTQKDSTPCASRCRNWESTLRKIASWSYIPNNVDAIRTALNNQVLSTTFDVYADFFYYTGGVYEHVSGERQGGHAVLLIGYDDVEHAWIAKNSWGSGWGENGFFKILWGDSGIGSDTIGLEYSNPCDDDEDGYLDVTCGGTDCDDEDHLVYPGAPELCDGKDSNCDGKLPPAEVDWDGDGWPQCADCNDRDPAVNPGEPETCGDGIDNDCSGLPNDKDTDGDGFLDLSCGGTDCDDEDPATYPGAPEICDGRDNNCDGILPSGERDLDGDTWLACAGDCNDRHPYVHPGRSEICGNGLDDDCDNDRDEADTECASAAWSAAPPASAAQISGQHPPSTPVSLAGSYLLSLLIPFLTIALGRVSLRRG